MCLPISLVLTDAENSVSVLWCWNQISETEFWMKQKRTALLLCQAKGNTVGPCSEKLCLNSGEFGEEFYSSGSRAGLLIRIRMCKHPAFLKFGLMWSPDLLRRLLHQVVSIFYLLGVIVLQNNSKIPLYVSFI